MKEIPSGAVDFTSQKIESIHELETELSSLSCDILDLKLENQKLLKYKNAWEELTETLTHYFELEFADTNVQAFMKELEEKHKVGV